MKKDFDFIGKRNIFFILSAIIMVISIGALLIKGLNLGIDFQGGTIIQIDINQSFETEDVRAITDTFDEGADITYAGEEQTRLVITTRESLNNKEVQSIFEQFKDEYNLKSEDSISADQVSSSFSKELQSQSLLACIVAAALMMVYISFRFQYRFGIAAVIALLHDIIVVVGVYAIFDLEVNSSFIAAVLTILGYSVNDTIVVFDRIRENKGRYKPSQLNTLVNDSIMQTLGRSINTTLTTLLAISALYIMGVSAIQEFTFPLIIGFISGSYSSIFIANGLWYLLEKRKIKTA